jgi:hypothetical protein
MTDVAVSPVVDERGSLLSELMVAAGLIVISVTIVGATLSGPLRGIAGLGHPQDSIEGVDQLGAVLAGAIRSARPHLDRPAVLDARPLRIVVALDHLRDEHDRATATWELRLEEDTVLVDGRAILTGVDAARTLLTYRDAAGADIEATHEGLDSASRSRIALVELRVALDDPTGSNAGVDVVHRAALRVLGPLA